MVDYTSISIPTEVKDRLETDKPADTGWGEYLSTLHSDHDPVAHVEPDVTISPDVLANALDDSLEFPEDVREQLDRIESAASTVEERTGQIQGTLEDMGARR